jgi:hypothetical protein
VTHDVDAYYRGLAMRNSVATAVNRALERDRRLLDAGRDWRRCMASGGRAGALWAVSS